MHEEDRVYLCTAWLTPGIQCKNKVEYRRWKIGKHICKSCGDAQATKDRQSWTILTPHKQGPMYFTAESARDMAKGINNKGGLIK